MESSQIQKEAKAFYFPGNKTGVLVIHGFTGTTQSMYEYGETLANEGYTVLAPRLIGHGTFPEQMEMASYLDWIKDVESGLEKIDRKSTRLNSSHVSSSYAVFCLKEKKA